MPGTIPSPLSNILDPISTELDPLVWDSPGSVRPLLKPAHAHWIKTTVYKTLESAGYANPHKWLKLVLTGSLTTYQYSSESDCDISLFIDSKAFPDWSRAEMIGIMVEGIDGTLLPRTPHPMQCFVVGEKIKPHDLYKPGLRSGYDLDSGQWIVPPEKERVHDVKNEQGGFYAWAQAMADKMERLLRYEPDKAVQFWHQLHNKRRRDQMIGKGDNSESNIIYKFLANRGLFPQIADTSGEYIAKIAMPNWQENPTVGYHVAPTRLRREIRERGLDPHAEQMNSSKHEPGVYLWDTPEAAMKYRGQGPNAYRDMDIHKVDMTGLPLQRDEWLEQHNPGRANDFPGAWFTTQHVDPERISDHFMNPWYDDDSPQAGWVAKVSSHTEFGQKVFNATLKDEGITIALDGTQPTKGYVFSPQLSTQTTVPLSHFVPDDIDEYIRSHLPELERAGMFLGTWISGGQVYIDTVENHPDREEAFKRAWDAHQLEMWDVENKQPIPVRGPDYIQPEAPVPA